jgi:ankyrin repeat protein
VRRVSPLFLACAGLTRGARLSDGSREAWRTAMEAQVECESSTLIMLLLESGADFEAADSNGIRPLWIAAHQGNDEAVDTLLTVSAAIDATALDGTTALWAAAQQGHAEVVRRLLDAKADAGLRSVAGIGPLDAARKQENTERESDFAAVIELLDGLKVGRTTKPIRKAPPLPPRRPPARSKIADA